MYQGIGPFEDFCYTFLYLVQGACLSHIKKIGLNIDGPNFWRCTSRDSARFASGMHAFFDKATGICEYFQARLHILTYADSEARRVVKDFMPVNLTKYCSNHPDQSKMQIVFADGVSRHVASNRSGLCRSSQHQPSVFGQHCCTYLGYDRSRR